MIQRIILTGPAGTGKSTTLEQLAKMGHPVMPDSAREIIRERLARGLEPRPSPQTFGRQILERDIRHWEEAKQSPTFYERGVPDALGMLVGAGIIDISVADEEAEHYPYSHAFLFPPWEEIYTTDEERDQTFAEAISIFASTANWYDRCGYTFTLVEPATPEERAAFILDNI